MPRQQPNCAGITEQLKAAQYKYGIISLKLKRFLAKQTLLLPEEAEVWVKIVSDQNWLLSPKFAQDLYCQCCGRYPHVEQSLHAEDPGCATQEAEACLWLLRLHAAGVGDIGCLQAMIQVRNKEDRVPYTFNEYSYFLALSNWENVSS